MSASANRIDTAFASLRSSGRTGLFPYLMAGFPTLDSTETLGLAAIDAGADGLELGVPFSDPLADGTTLQHAGEIALSNGASLAWTIALGGRLRAQTAVPLILMTYYNPIFHYGIEQFVSDARAAGIDGVIVPDLPSGEADDLLAAAGPRGLYLIQMLAPTSTTGRLDEVGRTAQGFVYCVSLLGTTGARATMSDQVPAFMAEVRRHVHTPLLIGFGIARPEHIAAVKPHADAVAIGGAIADLLSAAPAEQWAAALHEYIGRMRAACDVPGIAIAFH